ncbi:MAG: hypothetical protein ACTS8R_05030 [Arsenophonus sp. NC-QC1-MAG3]
MKERILLLIAKDFHGNVRNEILEEFNKKCISNFIEIIIDKSYPLSDETK